MNPFDPLTAVDDSRLILDHGAWPNFHDAEVHYLDIWRGDVRPDVGVWIGPRIEAAFELCALRRPYLAVLEFLDCEAIRLTDFNHQNALHDLRFAFEARGPDLNGEPLSPTIAVSFEHAFGAALSFRCFRVRALRRRPVPVAGETGREDRLR